MAVSMPSRMPSKLRPVASPANEHVFFTLGGYTDCVLDGCLHTEYDAQQATLTPMICIHRKVGGRLAAFHLSNYIVG
jgi:hypothetical protein